MNLNIAKLIDYWGNSSLIASANNTVNSLMSLTIADVGVISAIMFGICSGFWAILQNSLKRTDGSLAENSRLDNERCDRLGRRISSLEASCLSNLDDFKKEFNDYRVKISDDYAKKTELQEVKIELKNLEKIVNDNHAETMGAVGAVEKLLLDRLIGVECKNSSQ